MSLARMVSGFAGALLIVIGALLPSHAGSSSHPKLELPLRGAVMALPGRLRPAGLPGSVAGGTPRAVPVRLPSEPERLSPPSRPGPWLAPPAERDPARFYRKPPRERKPPVRMYA